MAIKIAKLLVASVLVALSSPQLAHADGPDQQFLDIVHANSIPGQDDALIAFARQFCTTNGPLWDTVLPLYGQGVNPGHIYPLKVAATRAYCPDKIAVPVAPGQVFTGLG